MCRVAPTHRTRRRSADLGGLHLATGNSGQGHGWLGYSCELEPQYAELLSDMYTEMLNAVNDRNVEYAPTDLPEGTRTRLIESLDNWTFEPHKLVEEEVLACTMILFEALFRIEGMQEAVGVDLSQIKPLIHHLRQIYRYENPYHNFEHALDVLQAAYTFLKNAQMVPPVTILEGNDTWSSPRQFDSGSLMTALGLRDLFVICIAAIGHDVGHPGFTNLFMKNASTPLSLVFSGQSALEQMHCSLLLRVMRHHGFSPFLDDPAYGYHVRKLLYFTVMATDMSVHVDFMERFKHIVVDKALCTLCDRQGAIAQAIIKCADISNPSRPYDVSKYWAGALMGEWCSQAHLEKSLDLPATMQQAYDDLSEARSQVFFINTFAKPLMELAVVGVPEMDVYLAHCVSNLQIWTSEVKKQETRTDIIPRSPRHDEYTNTFPLTLALHHRMSLKRMSASLAPSTPPPQNAFAWQTTSEYPLDDTAAPWRPSSSSAASSTSASTSSSSYYSCDEFSSCSEASFMFSPSGEGGESVSSGLETSEPSTAAIIDPHYAIRAAAGKAGLKRSQDYFIADLTGGEQFRKRNSWCVASLTSLVDDTESQLELFVAPLSSSSSASSSVSSPPMKTKTIVVTPPKPRLGLGVVWSR